MLHLWQWTSPNVLTGTPPSVAGFQQAPHPSTSVKVSPEEALSPTGDWCCTSHSWHKRRRAMTSVQLLLHRRGSGVQQTTVHSAGAPAAGPSQAQARPTPHPPPGQMCWAHPRSDWEVRRTPVEGGKGGYSPLMTATALVCAPLQIESFWLGFPVDMQRWQQRRACTPHSWRPALPLPAFSLTLLAWR